MASKPPVGEILGSPPEVGAWRRASLPASVEPGGVRHTVHRRTWRRASHRASPSLASRVTPYVDRVLRPVSHRASLEFVRRSSVVCEHKLAEEWLGHKSPQKLKKENAKQLASR